MHVIFLAPHFPANQRRFVQGLKNVGARVTGIGDLRPEYLDDELRHLLDGYEYVPSVTHEASVFDAVRRIQKRGPWVHRLEAVVEAHMLCAARVREATGIPGVSYETTNLCRDKFVMKQYLREHGIPCADNAVVDTAEDAINFVKKNGYPVIIKPRAAAGAAGTSRIDNAADLARAIDENGLEQGGAGLTMEEFISGHEGFYDTLTVGGNVVFEGISHYYPNVLTAMRTRETHAMIVTTNRHDAPGYQPLREFGQKVLRALKITTSATHMEWFAGPKGMYFSEIGARPPGINMWDVYCATNEMDLYTAWARAVCFGDIWQQQSRRFAGGVLNIRPNRDGTVQGYTGIDEMLAKYGRYILSYHLPPRGARTQPIEAGYRANAYFYVRHPDYDGCKAMMDEMGHTIRMYAA